MKYILIALINLYQLLPGPWHNSCKYIPTCSNYGIEAIKEYGEFICEEQIDISGNQYSKKIS